MARTIPVQHTGGVYDTSLTSTSMAIINQHPDPEQLAEDIGYLVGRCRCFIESRQTAPRATESIKHAEESIKLFNGLLDHLDKMPEDIKALMSLSPSDYYEKRLDDIRALAVQHIVRADQAINTAKTWPTSKGEKPKQQEQKLLSDIAQLFEDRGVIVTKSATTALQIVIAENIGYRPTTSKAREIIRDYRKANHPKT